MSKNHSLVEQHSLALIEAIKAKISQSGSISFSQFMQMALYQPGLGYYSSGLFKFGKQGDFITAPLLGHLFAQTCAKQFKQVLEPVDDGVIFELGAGTGQFCFDVLLALDKMQCLPKKYLILEVSADLQQRQQQHIAKLPKHLADLVQWQSKPPTEKFNGIIFANEVVDALAVEVFKYEKRQQQYLQMRVGYTDDFVTSWEKFPTDLEQQLIEKQLDLPDNYVSEFVPHLDAWLQSISENLNQGVVLLIDYGYECSSYYHPQRNQGTLVCYHQHQANFNYFDNIGVQDMTAFVDFTALAIAADACNLSVEAYATQAHFLMALGIHELLGDSENDFENYYSLTTEMKKLTLPNEMGEKFKVLALSRNFDEPLLGFTFSNQLHLL